MKDNKQGAQEVRKKENGEVETPPDTPDPTLDQTFPRLDPDAYFEAIETGKIKDTTGD